MARPDPAGFQLTRLTSDDLARYVMEIIIAPCSLDTASLASRLASELSAFHGCEVLLASARSEPSEALDASRGQYAARAFLDDLEAMRRDGKHESTDRIVLGVTQSDLFAPRLSFIFGEARRNANVAVVSIHRLRPQFYRQPAAEDLLAQRLLKEAIHELGHLRGLDHCKDTGCIMSFSNTISDTDRKGPGYCARCRALLEDAKASTHE